MQILLHCEVFCQLSLVEFDWHVVQATLDCRRWWRWWQPREVLVCLLLMNATVSTMAQWLLTLALRCSAVAMLLHGKALPVLRGYTVCGWCSRTRLRYAELWIINERLCYGWQWRINHILLCVINYLFISFWLSTCDKLHHESKKQDKSLVKYLSGWRCGVAVSRVRRWTKLTHVGPGYNWDGWPSSGGYTIWVCDQPTRSTQPCIPPGSLNRVPASAGVKAGMSPLPGGR